MKTVKSRSRAGSRRLAWGWASEDGVWAVLPSLMSLDRTPPPAGSGLSHLCSLGSRRHLSSSAIECRAGRQPSTPISCFCDLGLGASPHCASVSSSVKRGSLGCSEEAALKPLSLA